MSVYFQFCVCEFLSYIFGLSLWHQRLSCLSACYAAQWHLNGTTDYLRKKNTRLLNVKMKCHHCVQHWTYQWRWKVLHLHQLLVAALMEDVVVFGWKWWTCIQQLAGLRKPSDYNLGSSRVGKVSMLILWNLSFSLSWRNKCSASCLAMVVCLRGICSPIAKSNIFIIGMTLEAETFFSTDNSKVASLNGESTPRHSSTTTTYSAEVKGVTSV